MHSVYYFPFKLSILIKKMHIYIIKLSDNKAIACVMLIKIRFIWDNISHKDQKAQPHADCCTCSPTDCFLRHFPSTYLMSISWNIYVNDFNLFANEWGWFRDGTPSFGQNNQQWSQAWFVSNAWGKGCYYNKHFYSDSYIVNCIYKYIEQENIY